MSEMTPEAEEAMVGRMLRHQVGVDPDRLDPVLDLAAVGIVNSTWRNSPVEDWHAGTGPLDDGEMLRINAYTTWRVRQICRRWRADVGLRRDSDADVLDGLHTDDLDWLAVRIFRWMTDPSRRLPIGVTLGELAGAGLPELVDDVDLTLGALVATAERYGGRYALRRAAAHGGLACRHWWGTPTWPATVFAFLAALDDPRHPHWGPGGQQGQHLSPEPEQVTDRKRLQGTLLRRPWELTPEAARWIANAGIGYLRPPMPALPDDEA